MPEFSVTELWEKLKATAEDRDMDGTENHGWIVLWNKIIKEGEFYKISLLVNRSYVYAAPVPRSDVEAFMNDNNELPIRMEAFHRIWDKVKDKHIAEHDMRQARK